MDFDASLSKLNDTRISIHFKTLQQNIEYDILAHKCFTNNYISSYNVLPG